jgi:hypothetical protein
MGFEVLHTMTQCSRMMVMSEYQVEIELLKVVNPHKRANLIMAARGYFELYNKGRLSLEQLQDKILEILKKI